MKVPVDLRAELGADPSFQHGHLIDPMLQGGLAVDRVLEGLLEGFPCLFGREDAEGGAGLADLLRLGACFRNGTIKRVPAKR